jgi:DNA polymerase-3 subunit epsilon
MPAPDTITLNRLIPKNRYNPENDEPVKNGLILDLETTGLNHSSDKIIELGMVLFTYGVHSGTVFTAGESVSLFEDPGIPIPEEVIKLTGITNEMVSGKRIDDLVVQEYLETADLIIAHNAAFDRPFTEQRFSGSVKKPWACSLKEINWKAHGQRCSKLECLIREKCRMFFDGHRAGNDCEALLHVIATPFEDGSLPLTELLESARKTNIRLIVNTPYGTNDLVKARGYRWNGGNGNPEAKGWWRDFDPGEQAEEETWLRGNVFTEKAYDVRVVRLNALNRYSNRIS